MGRKIRIEKPRPRLKALNQITLILFALALLGIALYAFFLLNASNNNGSPTDAYFEVTNFSGHAELQLPQSGNWVAANRSGTFQAGTGLRTDKNGDLEFRSEYGAKFRLKPNSELWLDSSVDSAGKTVFHWRLTQGALLLSTAKKQPSDERHHVKLFHTAARIENGAALIQTDPAAKRDWIGVLRGVAYLEKALTWRRTHTAINTLHVAQIDSRFAALESKAVSKADWIKLKEIYELFQTSAAQEAKQLDLSKKAGDFFGYVFDHGTFYTPKIGYSGREFILDENSGLAYLDAEYDVYSPASYVGIYFKIREMDLSQFEGLEFEVRRAPDEPHPQSFQLEIKSKGLTLRRFAPAFFTTEWSKHKLDFSSSKSAFVSEMTLLFSHERAGEYKKGSLQFRNFHLIPKVKAPDPKAIEKVAAQYSRLGLTEFDDFMKESPSPTSAPRKSEVSH